MLAAAILVPSACRRPDLDDESADGEVDPCSMFTSRRALGILRSFLGEAPANGADVASDEYDGALAMLYALPGHEPISEIELASAQPSSSGPASPGRAARPARPLPPPRGEDGEDDIGPITRLSYAIGQLADIWAVLKGEFEREEEDEEARPKRKRMASEDDVDELSPAPLVAGGWELLEILVDAWEIDSLRRQHRHGPSSQRSRC